MGKVTSLERVLMSTQLAELRKAFQPGVSVVNWHSLCIPDFVAGFRKASTLSLWAVHVCWSMPAD